jgi:hypothetical protein
MSNERAELLRIRKSLAKRMLKLGKSMGFDMKAWRVFVRNSFTT